MARFERLFGPRNAPEKVCVGPFLRPSPGNEAHKLFSGGPKWGLLGGGQKVYVEKVCVLFPSPKSGLPKTDPKTQKGRHANPDTLAFLARTPLRIFSGYF